MKTPRKAAFIFVLLTACLLLAGGAAYAQTSRLYFAGYMGLNLTSEQEYGESTTFNHGSIEAKNTVSFAGALGLRFDDNWRVEGEISYRNADYNDIDFGGAGAPQKIGGNIASTLYMANVYYDFDFEWQSLYPFLSAGLGLAWHSVDIEDQAALMPDASDTSIGFAWSLGSGLKYRVSPNTAVTTGYRYIGTSDLEIDSYDLDYSAHEVRFGLEYDFPVGKK